MHHENINNLLYIFISCVKQIMKKIRLLTLLWVILVAWTLVGCWNKDKEWDFIIEDITWQNDAVIDYNDTLVDLASQCIAAENKVWNTYDSNDASTTDITSAINNLVNECSDAWEEINKLWGREWDNSLKDWVLAVIESEISYYIKFSELLPYSEKEELTEEENASYNSIYTELEAINTELSNANENLSVIQKEFADSHWFELEEVAEETAE